MPICIYYYIITILATEAPSISPFDTLCFKHSVDGLVGGTKPNAVHHLLAKVLKIHLPSLGSSSWNGPCWSALDVSHFTHFHRKVHNVCLGQEACEVIRIIERVHNISGYVAMVEVVAQLRNRPHLCDALSFEEQVETIL